jgi:hypothetical protein
MPTTARTRFDVLVVAAMAGWLAPAVGVQAALPVELEVAADMGAPLGAMQEWGRLLSEMDLAKLRLRGRTRADEPALSVTGEGEARRYHVVGILNRRDELVLPGGRFTQGDAARLKKFLEELPDRTDEAAIDRGMFGLTKEGFEALFADFSAVVAESTKGVAPADAVAAIAKDLKTPLHFDQSARAALAAARPLTVELQGMSRGSALAAALRPAGLALAPEEPRGQPAALRVVPIAPGVLTWPIGWKPEATPREAAPAMYQFRNIEIEGYTLAQALEALAAPFGAPIIMDERVLAAREIDPAKVQVKLPRRKTYLRRAVDQILSQARLAGELRVDEAGRAFYWVTQFGEDSPRAAE